MIRSFSVDISHATLIQTATSIGTVATARGSRRTLLDSVPRTAAVGNAVVLFSTLICFGNSSRDPFCYKEEDEGGKEHQHVNVHQATEGHDEDLVLCGLRVHEEGNHGHWSDEGNQSSSKKKHL